MDTSKKYVEMSKEAKKWLSNYFKGKPGDLYVGLSGKIHMVDSNIITDGMLHPDCTPLFRQDQLQEMLLEHSGYKRAGFVGWPTLAIPIAAFEAFCLTIKWKLKSMEQLWLAFVMKEKYQKVWDDKKKKWVKCQVAR